jgi:hypothetical protein
MVMMEQAVAMAMATTAASATTALATAAASAATAASVTGNGHLLTAHQGDADNREEHRDA